MLARSRSAGAICLGCQFRLLQQASRRPSNLASAARLAAAHRRRNPRWSSSDALKNLEAAANEAKKFDQKPKPAPKRRGKWAKKTPPPNAHPVPDTWGFDQGPPPPSEPPSKAAVPEGGQGQEGFGDPDPWGVDEGLASEPHSRAAVPEERQGQDFDSPGLWGADEGLASELRSRAAVPEGGQGQDFDGPGPWGADEGLASELRSRAAVPEGGQGQDFDDPDPRGVDEDQASEPLSEAVRQQEELAAQFLSTFEDDEQPRAPKNTGGSQFPRTFEEDEQPRAPKNTGDFYSPPSDHQGSREARRQQTEEDTRWKKLRLNKLHWKRNVVLSERVESLGANILGKPASVVVMKQTTLKGGRRSPEERFSAEERFTSDDSWAALATEAATEAATKATVGSTAQEMEADLNNYKRLPSMAEVRANIDELRPREKLLTRKDYLRTKEQLAENFLGSQLQAYLETYQPSEADVEAKVLEELDLKKRHAWVKDLRPWRPLDDGTNPRTNSDEHIPIATKERFAIRIMREWDVQVDEFMHGPGDIKVTLNTNDFVLLMRGTRRFLRVINEKFLEPGELIEASLSQKTLRIVTRKFKVDTILHELGKTLQNIKSRFFPLSALTRNKESISDELLEQVGSITNTHVRKSRTGNRLHVTWIELESRKRDPPETESLADVVFRLLYTALNPEPAARSLHTPAPPPGESRVQYQADTHNSEKWMWKDKLDVWARCVKPLTVPAPAEVESKESAREHEEREEHEEQQVPEAQEVQADAPLRVLPLPVLHPRDVEMPAKPTLAPTQKLGDLEILQPRPNTPYHPVRWAPTLSTTTTAVFGHVLHSFPAPALKDLLNPELAQPRIFSPVVPHPVKLARLQENIDETPTRIPEESIMLIRFTPAPTSPDRASSELVAPPLELRLLLPSDPDATAISGVHSLRAIAHRRLSDVLQPAARVDVRYTQTQYAALQGYPEDVASWFPVAGFLARARIDLAAPKLEMPARQRFVVPTRLFTRRQPEKQKTTTTTTTTTTEPEQTVDYMYAGLELHRSASMPYQGHTLTYTSIEAGKGGGRRAELSLTPGHEGSYLPPPPPAGEEDGDKEEGGDKGDDNKKEEENTGGKKRGRKSKKEGEEPPTSTIAKDYLRACYDLARSASAWSGNNMTPSRQPPEK